MAYSFPTTPPEDLRIAVEAQCLLHKQTEWRLLTGGRTNISWLVNENSDALVVKLYCRSTLNPLFPNDAFAEASLLHHLSPDGLAPRFVETLQTAHGTCNVYSYIPGQIWLTGTKRVADLMHCLHHTDAPSGLRSTANGSAELTLETYRILSLCTHTKGVADLEPSNVVPKSEKLSLLHNDIVPANLICSNNMLHLIDWQCPSQGDACLDLAVFLSPAMQLIYRGSPLTSQEVSEFLQAYGDPDVVTRYLNLAPHFHWRMAAYCLWQMEQGQSDYEEGLKLEVQALRRAQS
ncbi:phosphotransferase [Shimia abyssi]|uniref:Thiamine kinase-like enzyme n=1 Tax=Shimia abyssi TaxID=1662395 RepID=A0A2P8F499_9RHOB|nr:phosphotransferase [Shimia abyssi]PSL16550.1 thiamine kinase-like enzyme [Shimia abyssi]